MARKSSKSTPALINEVLYTEGEANGAKVGSPEWAAFLAEKHTFYFDASGRPGFSSFTARCETRRKGCLWYAFVKSSSKLFKAYLGRTETLDHEKLLSISQHLYKLIHEPKEGNVTK